MLINSLNAILANASWLRSFFETVHRPTKIGSEQLKKMESVSMSIGNQVLMEVYAAEMWTESTMENLNLIWTMTLFS